MKRTLTQLVASTSGADKVIRSILYLLRLIAARPGQASSSSLAQVIAALSESRVILRFFGLLQSQQSFYSLMNKVNNRINNNNNNSKKVIWREEDAVNFLQLMADFVYYPMEHLSWLNSKKVIALSPRLAQNLAQYSCRAWLFSLLLELYLLIGWQGPLLFQRFYNDRKKEDYSPPKQRRSLVEEERFKEIRQLRRECWEYSLRLLATLGDIPLALTWSFPQAKFLSLSPAAIGLCGTISSLSGLALKFYQEE